MASVLVYIDGVGGRPSAASRRVLAEARRLATSLGATLYAVAPAAEPWVEDLGRKGPDRIAVLCDPRFAGPPLWQTHGEALVDVADRVRPRLVLLPDTAAGVELGARLAARVEAAFAAEATIETGPRGELFLSRAGGDRRHRVRLAPERLSRPMIATLAAGAHREAEGGDDIDVLPFELGAGQPRPVEHLSTEDDPGTVLETARVVVVADVEVDSADRFAQVEELARALGGEAGATRPVCRRGLAPADREVGAGARRVRPELYVACGARTAGRHLGALASDAELVALVSDPRAPILRFADYALVGEVGQVIADLIAAVRARSARAA